MCDLTSGFTRGCANSVGGLTKVYLAQVEHKATATLTAGELTALTLTTGNRFWTYDVDPQTSFYTETITGSRENGTLFHAQSVTLVINQNTAAVRNEINLVAQNDLMVMVADGNGSLILLGYIDGLRLITGERGSGTAKGDRNGYSLTFEGAEKDPAPFVSSSLLATLTAPAA